MKKLRFFDLFCGCGGLSTGLVGAGLKLVGGVDKNKNAITSFKYNHKNVNAYSKGIDEFILNESEIATNIRKIDVLVGGPPCQGFSAINPKRSIDDPRNSCVELFLRVVQLLNPKLILLENVTGLIGLAKGKALKIICKHLNSNGYDVGFKVLQAAHYGVPQSRWRLFVVGSKLGHFQFPEPTHRASIRANFPSGNKHTFSIPEHDDLFVKLQPHTTVSDAITDLPELENGGGEEVAKFRLKPQNEFQRQLRNGANSLFNHTVANLGSLQMERVIALPKQGMNWLDLPEHLMPNNLKKLRIKYGSGLGCKSRFGRLSLSGLFTTILTQPHLYWGTFIHPKQNRVISVRECLRAQTFPDTFRVFGPKSSQYEQVGNAIPVFLGKALGKAIISHFKGAK